MRHPSEYVRAPKLFFQTGATLKADLYIYLPLNKSIILFLRQGETLSPADCSKLDKVPDGYVLITRSEQNKMLLGTARGLGATIRDGNINSSAVKQSAASILSSIDTAPIADNPHGEEVAQEVLSKVPAMVQEMISQLPKTPSVQAYDRVFAKTKSIAKNAEDPLNVHLEQVSALSSLILLTVGNSTSDEMVELATAGLLHDIGLKQLPRTLLEKHLIAEDDFNLSEKIIYMRHPEIAVETLETAIEFLGPKASIVTQNVLKTIRFHHENWNGTGFKGLAGNSISRPSRVLRIAEDIIGTIQNPKTRFGFKEAVEHLKEKNADASGAVYDPSIIELLGTL